MGKGQGFELRVGEARLVGRVQKLLTLRSEPDCSLIWRKKAGRMGAVPAKCVRDCLLQLLLSRGLGGEDLMPTGVSLKEWEHS